MATFRRLRIITRSTSILIGGSSNEIALVSKAKFSSPNCHIMTDRKNRWKPKIPLTSDMEPCPVLLGNACHGISENVSSDDDMW